MEQYRIIYEETYGVKLPKDFDVHHIDGNRSNNDPDNLIAIPRKLHQELHVAKNNYDLNIQGFSSESLKLRTNEMSSQIFLETAIKSYIAIIEKCAPYMTNRYFSVLNKRG